MARGGQLSLKNLQFFVEKERTTILYLFLFFSEYISICAQAFGSTLIRTGFLKVF